MITFHFHLQPQYKYELFHINFTGTIHPSKYNSCKSARPKLLPASISVKFCKGECDSGLTFKTGLVENPVIVCLKATRVWPLLLNTYHRHLSCHSKDLKDFRSSRCPTSNYRWPLLLLHSSWSLYRNPREAREWNQEKLDLKEIIR